MLFQKPTYDWLIAGLGNPGPEYEKTRHNTGFMSLDLLAARLQVKVSKERFKALTAQADFDGQRLLLMKPLTFMNASGIAIEAAAHFYKIPPERVLVLFDDISLPVGKLRIRKNGSAGGHNGLKSIINKLGTKDFSRIRVGIGMPPGRMPVVDWVLKEYRTGEMEDVRLAAVDAADAVETCLERGVIFARDHINGAGKPGSR